MSYCDWDKTSKLNMEYHNKEWGVPLHNDKKQFEFLCMEVMQCGLNWDMMINKREIFRKCFDDFDYDYIAKYNQKDIIRILNTEGMIKSVKKIEAIINNAKCFRQIRKESVSFCKYLWAYSDNKTIIYDKHNIGYIPASNGLSDKISKDLKSKGFKFLGPITVYSHLQACGIINDHSINCPRYKFINSKYPIIKKKRFLENKVSFFGNGK